MTKELASHKSIVHRLLALAAEKPDQSAFVFLDRGERESARLSYRALEAGTGALARHLSKLGLKGKRALLIYPPGLDFVVGFLACLRAGLIPVAAPYLIPRRSERQISAIARDLDPGVVLATDDVLGDARLRGAVAAGDTPWVASDVAIPADRDAPLDAVGPPDAIAFIQYSSGSTGDPKGVIITHHALSANLAMIVEAFCRHTDPRVLVSWLPAYHDMGLIGSILCPIEAGATAVLMSPLSFLQKPVRWLEAVSRYQATTSGGPTFAYALCTEQIPDTQLAGLDLSSWSLAYCGSETVRGGALEQFSARFKSAGFDKRAMFPCYGLAEATLFVTGGSATPGLRTIAVDGASLADRGEVLEVDRETPGARVITSCGRPAGAGRVSIAPSDDGETATGRAGEICVSGPHLAAGYWRGESGAAARPTDAAEEFGAESDRLLRTGDVGFIHDSELFVTGRLRDVIIIRGAKHNPEAIEATVAGCDVARRFDGAVAFGVGEDDDPRLVVLIEATAGKLDGEGLDGALKAVVGAITRDHGVRVDQLVLLAARSLKRTSSGKVRRQDCKSSFLGGAFERLTIQSRQVGEPA